MTKNLTGRKLNTRMAVLEVKLEEVETKNKGFGFFSYEDSEFAAERAACEEFSAEVYSAKRSFAKSLHQGHRVCAKEQDNSRTRTQPGHLVYAQDSWT